MARDPGLGTNRPKTSKGPPKATGPRLEKATPRAKFPTYPILLGDIHHDPSLLPAAQAGGRLQPRPRGKAQIVYPPAPKVGNPYLGLGYTPEQIAGSEHIRAKTLGRPRRALEFATELTGVPAIARSARSLSEHPSVLAAISLAGNTAFALPAFRPGQALKAAEEAAAAGRAVDEAALHARLKEIDSRFKALVDPVAQAFEPADVKAANDAAYAHNTKVNKARRGTDSAGRAKGSNSNYTGANKKKTVREESRILAEKHIIAAAKAHPERPGARVLLDHLEEARKIRAFLSESHMAKIPGEDVSPLAGVEPFKPIPFKPGPARVPSVLFHGSPEGTISNPDVLHHTKMWREGSGFYLTPDVAKANKYAAGRTAGAARRDAGTGAVSPFTINPDAKILNVDTAPTSFWHGLAEQIVGEKIPEATWKSWASDVTAADRGLKGASEGVLNRARLNHLLTGWAEMPQTDAYYAIEEAIHERGFQATLHHENGVPVFIVKDQAALSPIRPPAGPPRAAVPAKPPVVVPEYLAQDRAHIAASLADIKSLDAKGTHPNADVWTNMVSSAARVIKWDKFPNRRAAIVDWFERQQAKNEKRIAEAVAKPRPGPPRTKQADVVRAGLADESGAGQTSLVVPGEARPLPGLAPEPRVPEPPVVRKPKAKPAPPPAIPMDLPAGTTLRAAGPDAVASALRRAPGVDRRPASVTLVDGSVHQVNPLHPVNTAGDEVLLLDGNSADISLVQKVNAGNGQQMWGRAPAASKPPTAPPAKPPAPPAKPPAAPPPPPTPPPPPPPSLPPGGIGGIGTPEYVSQQLEDALKLRKKQERLYHAERSIRAGNADVAMKEGGMAGYKAALGTLKGELPKLRFGGFDNFDQAGLDALFTHVQEHPTLRPYDKIRTQTALLGVLQGKVPTRSEIKLLNDVFGAQVAQNIAESVPFWIRAKTVGLELLNVPRALMASFDLSAPFRQGLMVSVSHPRIFFRNFNSMFKSFGSERTYHAIHDEILARPTWPLMHDSGLSITELGRLEKREEQFMSNYAEKIPVAGHGVRASGRAYTAFLNKTRADVFDLLVKKAEAQGLDIEDEKVAKSIARFVNSATGRGDLGTFQSHAVTLNTLMFSPRLLWSRLNFMNPAYYARLDPFARKEALKAAVGLVGTLGTILGLMRAGGIHVSGDPRNADWAKIRLGNTRVDILGGFQQPARLIAQLATGKVISSTTGKTMTLGPQGPGKLSRRDIIQRFGESKLSPVPSFVNDALKGTDFSGQPFSWKTAAVQRMIPLLAQDMKDLYQEKGLTAALGGYAVGSLGIGLQTYRPKPTSSRGPGLGKQDTVPGASGAGAWARGAPTAGTTGGSAGGPGAWGR